MTSISGWWLSHPSEKYESQFCQLCPWVLARRDMSPRLLAHLTICTHSPLFRWPWSSEICNSVSSRMEVFPNSLGRSWPIHQLRSTIDRKNGFCIPILPQRTALLYLQSHPFRLFKQPTQKSHPHMQLQTQAQVRVIGLYTGISQPPLIARKTHRSLSASVHAKIKIELD